MRIVYLKLKNFKGIFAGMGKKEIEINFSECDKRIVLLLGANGSGKSTIMSMLHPFMESFDGRDSLILDDHDGYKEIWIQKGEDLYRIEHFYGKKNKSFIYKNDESLNESGGIRTFLMIVEEELGVNSELFKIIRIGSNSKNFIDLQASARKQYLGKFTPSIEMYVQAYKVVNEKLLASNKEIKFVTDELQKIDPEAEVKERIHRFEKALKKLTRQSNELEVKILQTRKGAEDAEAAIAEFADELEERKEKQAALDTQEAQVEAVREEYKGLREYDSAACEAKIREFSSEISRIEKELQEAKLTLERLQATRQASASAKSSAEIELRKYASSSSEDIEDLLELESSYLGEIETCSAQLGAIAGVREEAKEIPLEVATSESSKLERLGMDVIEAKREMADLSDEVVEIALSESEDQIQERIDKLASDIRKSSTHLQQKKKSLRAAEDDMLASMATSKVAGLCRNATCEVFRIGQNHREKGKRIEEMKKEVAEQENSQDVRSQLLEDLRVAKSNSTLLQLGIRAAIEESKTAGASEALRAVVEESGGEVGRVVFSLAAPEIKDVFDLSKVVKVSSLARKIESREAALAGVRSRIRSMKDSKSFVREIEERVAAAAKQIASILPEEQQVKKTIAERTEAMERKADAVEVLRGLKAGLDSASSIRKELRSLNKIYENNLENIKKVAGATKEVEALSEEKASLDEDIARLAEELASYNTKLARIKEYQERKSSLIEGRDALKVVKDALDIKTGIPLHILGSYLEGIKEEANRLLAMAFGESFALEFSISDTDFSIPVYKNGVCFAKDVTECSQGETALVKSSLSLGITSRAIRQSENKYNLVYLDEADSELDSKNRYKFLDILERQLDALSCEQCFVITHNEAFATAEIGVILLKDANFDSSDEATMFNKTVIADFRR